MSLSKNAIGHLYLALSILGLAGCTTTRPGYFAATSSTISLALSAPAAQAIASDMVGQLAHQIGPGTGPVIVQDKDTVMSRAVEDKLRAHGFAVDPSSQSETAIALAYTITGQPEQIFVRLTSPQLEMTRVYAATDHGAISLTPMSILRPGNDPGEVP